MVPVLETGTGVETGDSSTEVGTEVGVNGARTEVEIGN